MLVSAVPTKKGRNPGRGTCDGAGGSGGVTQAPGAVAAHVGHTEAFIS